MLHGSLDFTLPHVLIGNGSVGVELPAYGSGGRGGKGSKKDGNQPCGTGVGNMNPESPHERNGGGKSGARYCQSWRGQEKEEGKGRKKKKKKKKRKEKEVMEQIYFGRGGWNHETDE